jgi:tRNA threonylcarbamoyladenosine biosynthesis protein TsaE
MIAIPAEGDFRLDDETATQRLGRAVARTLQRGDAICLYGPLGSGKSTLARALIRALTHAAEEVPSPTFTLVQTYEAAFPLAHFDLYRLVSGDEVAELGLDEALAEGAAVIEWPQRLEGRLPHSRLDIEIEIEGQGRRARLTPHGDFEGRPLEF